MRPFHFTLPVAFLLLCQTNACTEIFSFQKALRDGDASLLTQLLADPHPQIDPNFKAGKALKLACEKGNLELLKALLRHPELKPELAGDYPMSAAIILSHVGCLLELLSDPRVSVDCVFDNGRFYLGIQNSYVIWGLNKDILKACSEGKNEVIKSTDLSTLRFYQFDLLMSRAKNHPAVQNELRHWFLRACRMKQDIDKDVHMLRFISYLKPMKSSDLRQIIQRRRQLDLVSPAHKPLFDPHLLDEIARHFEPEERSHISLAKSPARNFYLDNYKYLAFANQIIELDDDQETVFEYWMQARTFGTGASPYPSVLLKCPDDDVRLAAASVNIYDPTTELYFNFLVTNDMVYAVYGRNADKRDPQDYNYAAFNFVIPLLWRKPSDTHKLKVILGKRQRTVRWKIDNKEYFRVESVGARISREYMTADFGGADDEVFPESVQYGFGSMTLLNHYPACWRACDNKPCIFTAVQKALYKTGNEEAPAQYDPKQGKPIPADFWNTDNTDERFRVWGQGSATFIKRLSVYLQKCKNTNINRYKTITVTATVTALPTRV